MLTSGINQDSISLENKYGKSVNFLMENPLFVIKQKLLEYRRTKEKEIPESVLDDTQVTPNHILQAAKNGKTCLICKKTFTTPKSLHCHVMEMHGGNI